MSILIRLTTGAGRTRLTVPGDATLQDLKQKIEEQTKVPFASQVLCFEREKPVPSTHSAKISSMGMENGTMLFLKGSSNAEIKATTTNTSNLLAGPGGNSSSSAITHPETQQTGGSSSSTAKADSSSSSSNKDNTNTNSSSTKQQTLQPQASTKSFVSSSGTLNGKVVQTGGSGVQSTILGGGKKEGDDKKEYAAGFLVNGKPMEAGKKCCLVDGNLMEAVSKKEEPKHISFEKFLKARRFDTASLPGNQSYLPTKLERGKQNKLPPPITLSHQKFRHVDHLEYMNSQEVQNFVANWQKEGNDMMIQRGGFMYGYYRQDKHYEDGVRAVLEAIYEPNQEFGWESEPYNGTVKFSKYNQDMYSKKARDSPVGTNGAGWDTKIPDLIAERLGLDRIGWIYTGLPRDELLNSQEVYEIATLQHKYGCAGMKKGLGAQSAFSGNTNSQIDIKHYSGYDTVSTFLSVTVRPDTNNGGMPDTKVFMVSDQAVAMIRDGLLDSSNMNPKRMKVKKNDPKNPDLMLPTVLESGRDAGAKEAEEKGNNGSGVSGTFDPDWCIIRISDGAPVKKRSIFVHSKFPVENRSGKMVATRSDLKNYMMNVGKGGESWARFADFHLLCYLAKELDLETVYSICDSIRERKEVLGGILEMVDAMCH